MANAGKMFTTATHKTKSHELDPKQFAPEQHETVSAAPAGGRVAISVKGPKGLGHTTMTPADAKELGELLILLASEAEASAPAPAAE